MVDDLALSRISWQGFAINTLNPKTALFFLAFLPPFLDPARGAIATQTFILGCLLAMLGLANDLIYALLAGQAGEWLKASRRFQATERWVSGGLTGSGQDVVSVMSGWAASTGG